MELYAKCLLFPYFLLFRFSSVILTEGKESAEFTRISFKHTK